MGNKRKAAEKGTETKATKITRTYSPGSRGKAKEKKRNTKEKEQEDDEQNESENEESESDDEQGEQNEEDISSIKQKERKVMKRMEKNRDKREREQDNENEQDNVPPESEGTIPPQFETMNQLQICNWLVLHPNILHLANQMLEALSAPSSSSGPSVPSSLTTTDNDKYRLIDEEMKCLFLRSRNPPEHAFGKITQKVFGPNALSVVKSVNDRFHRAFADYRYQLKTVLLVLVKELRNMVEGGYTEGQDPTEEEINNFISHEVVFKKILSRHLSAVDLTELPESSLEKLISFCRKCFKIVWDHETESAVINKKIKDLDDLTKNIEVPSRSGTNIASSLKLIKFKD